MDVHKGMAVFAAVAKQESFAGAARQMQLSRSAVSRHVIELEEWLGVQLLTRTTRALSLTDAGRTYFERCELVLSEIEDMRRDASEQHSEAQGPLRVTAPVFIAKNFLQDLLPGYLNTFPKVAIELVAIDRFVDLTAEGFDLAVRAGELHDSSLIARRLMDVGLSLVASPEYVERCGAPKSAEDLTNHNCIVDTVPGYANRWPVSEKRTRKPTNVRGNIKVNSGEITRSLALAGVGVALLPDFMVANDIREERLVSLLGKHVHFAGGLFAIYPQRRHLSPNVRTFVDYLVAHVSQLELLQG